MVEVVLSLFLTAAPATVTDSWTGASVTVPAYVEPCVLLPKVSFDAEACAPATEAEVQTMREKLAAPELLLWGVIQVGHGAALVQATSISVEGVVAYSDEHLDVWVRGAAPPGFIPDSFGPHLFKIVDYP